MKLDVRLFAAARQVVGSDMVQVDVPTPATVAAVRDALVKHHPGLVPLIAHTRFAIDAEYAGNDDVIPDKAEIACIPPVSGG